MGLGITSNHIAETLLNGVDLKAIPFCGCWLVAAKCSRLKHYEEISYEHPDKEVSFAEDRLQESRLRDLKSLTLYTE
ncbi:hypothetical protein C5167_048955 [Papaver somniferum]|uniref:Uncharacterized protein n=1 Tax=Papaver somniferum TaxID=3469 RepID=A0A4Y7KM53_PAPSO|nr:hypothetical protein C5167_048955 [Papaver somniferum]